ncbi:MAG: DNA adenine methylase [Prevotellaceae bacterium]|jgi:DNA adenine methylase|nr:DNA adenine methylase [Prevotellaceae bacterium]
MKTDKFSIVKDDRFDLIKEVKINTETGLKPFLKWPGGKSKELKVILPNLPERINNFYEPFIGGGAVYFAVTNAKHYFINDQSKDLIDLYQNIKSDSNAELFDTLSKMDDYWKELDRIYETHKLQLVELFLNLREDENFDIKNAVNTFIETNITDFQNPIHGIFSFDFKFYTKELKLNLYRKMSRMRQIEKEKGLLPDEDINSNILTAIKSSFYMYFRELYNKHEKYNIKSAIYSAIYFFIRNYTYSGMFRYNADGEFNVPYGGIGYNGNSLDKKIKYISSGEVQNRLKNTTIENKDFYGFMKSQKSAENDFIFLDPPYDTEFSTYDQNEFTQADQIRLSKFLTEETVCKWMLVIKNTDFIHHLYEKQGIFIKYFDKSYNVSFMNRNERKTEHLMITNYRNTHDKKINSDTQGDDYIAFSSPPCPLSMPERGQGGEEKEIEDINR